VVDEVDFIEPLSNGAKTKIRARALPSPSCLRKGEGGPALPVDEVFERRYEGPKARLCVYKDAVSKKTATFFLKNYSQSPKAPSTAVLRRSPFPVPKVGTGTAESWGGFACRAFGGGGRCSFFF
jgi:hypothetical protein